MTDIELGWLAGFIDGEGTITLRRVNNWRYPFMSASSTDLDMLREVQRLAGGVIYERSQRNFKHKRSWCWKISSGRKALDVIRIIQPHLHCPQKQRRAAYLITNYPSVTTRNGWYTSTQKQLKADFEKTFFSL